MKILDFQGKFDYSEVGKIMWVIFVIGIVIGIVIAICGFFLHFYSKKDLGKKFFEDSTTLLGTTRYQVSGTIKFL